MLVQIMYHILHLVWQLLVARNEVAHCSAPGQMGPHSKWTKLYEGYSLSQHLGRFVLCVVHRVFFFC